MVATCDNVRWDPIRLNLIAKNWVVKMQPKQTNNSHKSMWWFYIYSWKQKLESTINTFINGFYRFNPMTMYRFTDSIITTWSYADRLNLRFLRKIITPVIRHLILPSRHHLDGSTGIKKAINSVEKFINNGNFRYFIRADVKDYYASIDHKILVNQTKKCFDDPRICKYLEDIITVAIDDGGEIKLPTKAGSQEEAAYRLYLGRYTCQN